MANETIPNRTSDAGPESTPQDMDWRDHLEEARCEIDWVAGPRSERDDLNEERQLRLLRLRNALNHLWNAERIIMRGGR